MLLEKSGEIAREGMKKLSQSGKNARLWLYMVVKVVWCCKGPYCIGSWNVRSMIQGKFSSVAQSCPSLCDPMDSSRPGFRVHQLLEFAQTHVHQVGDTIQPAYPLSSPFPPAFNLSQHQGLFKWVSSSNQVVKVLELQLQSFQWLFRTDFL